MFRRILLLLVLSSLIGCSGTLYVYKENVRLLLQSAKAAEPDRAFVAASKYDVIQVSFADKRAIMALAFVENGQHKFISADNGFLIFANGRIVRTAGFVDNLLHVDNLAEDPLQHAYTGLDGASWQFVEQTNTLPAQLNQAQFKLGAEQSLSLLGHSFTTILLTETVTPRHKSAFVNLYWFDLKTGELLQTKQHLASMPDAVTIVFLSSANRILAENPEHNK
ncbi:YjbF family lipoprotein [Rheinheimera maricola]|uniref:YjbF family lipoprotein n=1 Tax=Rheinheimera maricola TaxID=2793282 RepID=A0ABS7X4A1_9GAMM|nr:YjbF family lipoprotein [Rheinheimera maricola]MBZ9610372.1 YjbF family lipoprotein [Rheinheimera maricola]